MPESSFLDQHHPDEVLSATLVLLVATHFLLKGCFLLLDRWLSTVASPEARAWSVKPIC